MSDIGRPDGVEQAVRTLWQESSLRLEAFFNPLRLANENVRREQFRAAFRNSWFYAYIPIATSFGSVPPNAKRDSLLVRYRKPSPIEVRKAGNQFLLYCNAEQPEPTFYPDTLTLANIFEEIWWSIASVLAGENARLEEAARASTRRDGMQRAPQSALSFAAFRPQQRRPDLVSVDVLAAWVATSPCSMQRDAVTSSMRLAFPSVQPVGYQPPIHEFGGKQLHWAGVGQLAEGHYWSPACFPAFYDDMRCSGVVLTSGRQTWLNGAPMIVHERIYGDEQLPVTVQDALDNGVIPLVGAFVGSGTFGYAYKLHISFGALSGDQEMGYWASSASLILGLHCLEGTARAVAENIVSNLGVLKHELLNVTARRALRRMHEQSERLEREKRRVERYAQELRRSKQLLELLQSPFERIATQLNGALVDIQRLQGIYRVPARGVYERAARTTVKEHFRQGHKLQICGQWFTVAHEPVHYDVESARLILLAVLAELTGVPGAPEARSSAEFAASIRAHLFDPSAEDPEIREVIRSIISSAQGETWQAQLDDDPIGHLETLKTLLHTALKPANGSDIGLRQLAFALPRLSIEAGSWVDLPRSCDRLLALGASNPFPTQAMFIEAIAGLSGLNEEQVADGADVVLRCTHCELIDDPFDNRVGASGTCRFTLERTNGAMPFIGERTLDSPVFSRLMDPDLWRDWANAYMQAAAGNFVEPIARMLSFAQSSEFTFHCQNLGGLQMVWRHPLASAELCIVIRPHAIEFTSRVGQ